MISTRLTVFLLDFQHRIFVDSLVDAGADAVVLVPLLDQPGDPVAALADVLSA